MSEWWLEPPFLLRELLHAHVDDLVVAQTKAQLPTSTTARYCNMNENEGCFSSSHGGA